MNIKCTVRLVLSVLAVFSSVFMIAVDAADVLIPTKQITNDNESRYFLISIGVNNFSDDFWPPLKWPVRDATRVAEKLGQDTNNQVMKTLLIGKSATIDEVTASLTEIARQATSADTVVLYVSSHGTLAQNTNGRLERIVVLQDTQQDRLFSTGLPHKALQDWLEGLKSRKKMLIFATCHSGEGKSRLPAMVEKLVASNKGKLIALSDVSEGAIVLAAAAKGEAARESDELQGDIYTHYLLEALTVYDRNRDGMVSALEAHDYARDRTWTFTQGQQRPTANIKLIGDADVPLYGERTQNGLAVLEAYDTRMAGFFVQIDNGEKGRLPFAFPLINKKSDIKLYTPGSDKPVSQYRVKVSPGQTVSLDQVMYDRPLSLNMVIYQAKWSDSTWKKLTGSNNSKQLDLSLSYHWAQNFGLGLLLGFTQRESARLIDIIDTSTQLRSMLLQGEYRYVFDPLWVSGRLQIGQETVKIVFSDQTVDDQLEFEDVSFAYGASVVLGYTIVSDFSLLIEAGYRKVDWGLDIIGNLKGDRYWFGLGLDYRFGSLARTKW